MTGTETDSFEPALEVDGFRAWLPLPTEPSLTEFLGTVLELVDLDPRPRDVIEAIGTELHDLGVDLVSRSDDETLYLASWVLLPTDGRVLDVRGLVTLCCVRITPDTTPTDFVEHLASEVNLYQPPVMETIDTRSGPATLVRLRQFVEHENQPGGDLALSEVVLIFWLDAELGVAYELTSLPMPDLVSAADLADHLVPLAASVRGL